jgi:2-iminobutanoate/2-iminopropanoate deaminase
MPREIIHTDNAPTAIGPYSQGTAYGGLVFTAGQIPLDPETGKIVEGDIVVQAGRVVDNLSAVLREAGSGLERVLRLDVYLTDLSCFPSVNEFLSRGSKVQCPTSKVNGAADLLEYKIV